jgi:hypothetical protein
VLLLPESPADRYQLVHDYLVEFIRQQQGNKLLAKLAKAESALKQEQEARQILANVNLQVDQQIKWANFRSAWTMGVSVIFSMLVMIAVGHTGKQIELVKSEINNLLITQKKSLELQKRVQELESKKSSAEAKAQAVDNKQRQSTQKPKKLKKPLQ